MRFICFGLFIFFWIVFYMTELPQFIEWSEQNKYSKKFVIRPIEKIETKDTKPEAPAASELRPEQSNLAPDIIGTSQSFAALGFGSGESNISFAGSNAGANSFLNRKADSRPARLREKSELIFPQEARRQNITGIVSVKILVANNGSVDRVEIINSDPPGFFEKSAIESIRKWKFDPAVNEGQVQTSWVSQKVKFELE
jgi:protein TonB